jgi:hypothetical protein
MVKALGASLLRILSMEVYSFSKRISLFKCILVFIKCFQQAMQVWNNGDKKCLRPMYRAIGGFISLKKIIKIIRLFDKGGRYANEFCSRRNFLPVHPIIASYILYKVVRYYVPDPPILNTRTKSGIASFKSFRVHFKTPLFSVPTAKTTFA